jgi:23S rRNA (guanosine2251-2'-O)-methyltransferase
VAGRRPVLEVLRAGRGAERVLIARELAPSRVVGEIRRRAEAAGVPVRVVARADIDRLSPEVNHQGVVALTGPFRYTPLEDVLATEDAAVAFLDGVMDPHNLGSILRSADAAGLAGVVVAARRAAGVTSAVRRVSAGAAEIVPVARVPNLGRALDAARRAGLWTVGLDQDADEDLWTSQLMEPPVALVLGSEDRGISPGVRRHCDAFVSIPQRGRLASLNVATAAAIAMLEVARRRALSGPREQPEESSSGSTLDGALE